MKFINLITDRLSNRLWPIRQALLQSTQFVFDRSKSITLNQDPSAFAGLLSCIMNDTLQDTKYVAIRSQSLSTLKALLDKIDPDQVSYWTSYLASLKRILKAMSDEDRDSSIRATSRSLLLSLDHRFPWKYSPIPISFRLSVNLIVSYVIVSLSQNIKWSLLKAISNF